MKKLKEKEVKQVKTKKGETKRVWSAAEDTKLALSIQKGVPIKMIAKGLGKTESAVSARRRKLGIDESLVSSPKDNAKTLSRLAREIARVNGKRITMSMFFVEDLD